MPPEPQVYLNGRFIPRSQATVDIEDRGFIFADGIYEVIRYYFGAPFAMDSHMVRLRRSLDAIALPRPAETEDMPRITLELLAKNGLSDAKAYWHMTRGSAPRDHAFPKSTRPTVLAMVSAQPRVEVALPLRTVTVITRPDERWNNCWIKSLMLLPNVIARNAAQEAGAFEAILHRDGVVTEATASSLFIVRDGELWTHPANQWILGGITRLVLIDLAKRRNIPVMERTFTVEELFSADEVIVCGTTTHVAAVTHVDQKPIAGGKAGPLTLKLQAMLMRHIVETCGKNT